MWRPKAFIICGGQQLLIYVEAKSFYNMWRPKALFSHNGYGPGTRAQGPKAAGPTYYKSVWPPHILKAVGLHILYHSIILPVLSVSPIPGPIPGPLPMAYALLPIKFDVLYCSFGARLMAGLGFTPLKSMVKEALDVVDKDKSGTNTALNSVHGARNRARNRKDIRTIVHNSNN